MVLVPGRGLDLKGKTLIGFVRKPSFNATRPPEGESGEDITLAPGDPHSGDVEAVGFLDWVKQLFKRRDDRLRYDVCAECGQPVKKPFDLKAAQRAASEHMAKNPGLKVDVRELLPLCEGCQSAWDEGAKQSFGPSGRIRIS